MRDGWLLIETSATPLIGVSVNGEVVASRALEGGRKHNRELIPAVQSLLGEARTTMNELAGIRVGVGPGSYTGLRIGITAAKALAYGLEKPLIAVPTYSIIANRAPTGVSRVDVIGDALNRTIYVQRFGPVDVATGLRSTLDDVHIEDLAEYLRSRESETWISGPGATTFANELPVPFCLPVEMRMPDLPTLERVGRTITALNRAEMMALEPLYLRGSSAEEKAKQS